MPNYPYAHDDLIKYADKQERLAAADLQAERRERFGVPQADERIAEADRLAAVSTEAWLEQRAFGEMMRRLVNLKEKYRDPDEREPGIEEERVAVLVFCDTRLGVLGPKHTAAETKAEVARVEYLKFVAWGGK